MTTRTIHGVKFVKASNAEAQESGAFTLWLTEDDRFELRGDSLREYGEERDGIEWGVWDRRERKSEGDWAAGGRGNGVENMKEGARLVASIMAEEHAAMMVKMTALSELAKAAEAR